MGLVQTPGGTTPASTETLTGPAGPEGPKGTTGAAGAEGPQGTTGASGAQGAGAVPILLPLTARNAPIATTTGVIGLAFKAIFQRCIVPNTGKIRDISVWNGATVNGNNRVAVFDVGDAVAGKYTPLWEGAETAMAGANGWQSLGAPELAVEQGQEIMLALMNSGTTATFGLYGSLLNTAAAELPAGYLPVSGGAAPKISAFREYTELKYAAATEAQLQKGGSLVAILGRIS
jgi:hypothetical protein